jgi:hypothetical protein
MPPTQTLIVNAQPRAKTYRHFDGAGLYLEVSPRGGKWWRAKYQFGGRDKRLSLGVFPAAHGMLVDSEKNVAAEVGATIIVGGIFKGSLGPRRLQLP